MTTGQTGIDRHTGLVLALVATLLSWGPAALWAGDADGTDETGERPSVLLIVRAQGSGGDVDYDYLERLRDEGFDLDVWILNRDDDRDIDWEMVSQYNALLIEHLPPSKDREVGRHYGWHGPGSREQVQPVLQKYLEHGGGIFFLPDVHTYEDTVDQILELQAYLEPWGAALAVESIHDPDTERRFTRNRREYIYTDRIASTPVTEDVRGLWLPVGPVSDIFYHQPTSPLDLSEEWEVTVRGGPESYTRPRDVPRPKGRSANREPGWAHHRDAPDTPPALVGVREVDEGRLALAAVWHNFHLGGGTRWVHDSVLLERGLEGKPSDFHRLLVNTLHWLAEPSMRSGELGGYEQDPMVLLHPHHRQEPEEFFPEFDEAQNHAPIGEVHRGLIGARTNLSTGTGSVADYAQAARDAGLDFVVFLDELHAMDEDDLVTLEADTLEHTDDDLVLLPGYSFESNIGDRMFFYGRDLQWPYPHQLDEGEHGPVFRLQNFDEDGKLTNADNEAKALLWHHVRDERNVGYYHFRDQPGVPTRNLRLFGMFGVKTYIDGELVEDASEAFRQYTRGGNPPLAGSVNLVQSPEALAESVERGDALTFVTGRELADVPELMRHGHAFGRANVYPSEGPKIHSWAGTKRVMTFAGEPFVTARARIRPLAWVSSDVGLEEVVIREGNDVLRRIELDGATEFRHKFEWSYDRQRILTLEAIDVEGRRAQSTGLEIWDDANMNMWMGDRQNTQAGELWHGPGDFTNEGAARAPRFSQGPTWDGGGHESFIGWGVDAHPTLRLADDAGEQSRRMDALQLPNYFGASDVANIMGVLDRTYAPGRSLNAYHTLGPTEVSDLVHYRLWRTQYQHRRVGPMMDSHAMWSERMGGNKAVITGEAELQRDGEIDRLRVAMLRLRGFNGEDDDPNQPLYAIRTDDEATVELIEPEDDVARWHLIEPGGYVALFPSHLGNNSMIFNTGDRPLRLSAGQHWWLEAQVDDPVEAGDVIDWEYTVVYDEMDHPDTGVERVEQMRAYLGIDGAYPSGLDVTRGELIEHHGQVTLEAEDGAVALEVEPPDFNFNAPLGLRFVGLNPNWTVGQWQQEGYNTEYYNDSHDVYRNIGLDDRGIGYLAIYPDQAPTTRQVIGHPVVADDPDLVIQFTPLGNAPWRYYIAVHNPTERPIEARISRAMDVPGLTFEQATVQVPPGALRVVFDEREEADVPDATAKTGRP